MRGKWLAHYVTHASWL